MTDVLKQVFGEAEGLELDSASDEAVAVLTEQLLYKEGAVGERSGNTLSYAEKVAILEALEEHERRQDFTGHLKWFPDEGPLSYKAYKKHIAFLALGAEHRERMFMAGNRVGKSFAGGFEMACHLTGMYPHWWEGRRFAMPTDCWAAGDTTQTTRDIVQYTLLGDNSSWGTGMIAKDLIEEVRMRPGGGGAVDMIRVKHTSGGTSKLGFKSYDQKRRSFQGTKKHAIWLDEEPPLEVYGECLMRTMRTGDFPGGLVFVTFTPLMGITSFVQEFLDATNGIGAIEHG